MNSKVLISAVASCCSQGRPGSPRWVTAHTLSQQKLTSVSINSSCTHFCSRPDRGDAALLQSWSFAPWPCGEREGEDKWDLFGQRWSDPHVFSGHISISALVLSHFVQISLPVTSFSLAYRAFAPMPTPLTISASPVTADRCLTPLLQRKNTGHGVESTHANLYSNMHRTDSCTALSASPALLYAKHFKWIFPHKHIYPHFWCPHQKRNAVLLFPVSQDHYHHRWQTDIISSPEAYPAAATFITPELIHTSNNQGPLATALYRLTHTLTHMCNGCIFEHTFPCTPGYIHIIARTVNTHRHHINTYLISKELSVWPSTSTQSI